MRRQLVIGVAAVCVFAVAAVVFVVAATSGPAAGGGRATSDATASSSAPASAEDAGQGTDGERPLTPEEQDIVRRMFAPAGSPPAPAAAPAPAPAAPQWPVTSPTPEQRAHLDAEGERKRAQMRRAGRGEKPPRSAEDLE